MARRGKAERGHSVTRRSMAKDSEGIAPRGDAENWEGKDTQRQARERQCDDMPGEDTQRNVRE